MTAYHGSAIVAKTTAASASSLALGRRAPPDNRATEHQHRQRERHRPFRQNTQRRGRRRQGDQARWARLLRRERAHSRPNRRGDEEGERQVGERHAREREVSEAGRRYRAGNERGAPAVEAVRDPERQQHHADSRDCRRRARRRGADAAREVGQRDEPVEENRFFESVLIVEVRRAITVLEHLAPGLAVERPVGICEAPPEPAKNVRHRGRSVMRLAPAGILQARSGSRQPAVTEAFRTASTSAWPRFWLENLAIEATACSRRHRSRTTDMTMGISECSVCAKPLNQPNHRCWKAEIGDDDIKSRFASE